jgi:peptidoglycan hydrolase CwlO-like protein
MNLYLYFMNLGTRKYLIFTKLIVFFLLVLLFLCNFNSSIFVKPVQAETSEELSNKLSDLNKELDALKQQKKDIENKITQESKNQTTLAGQISFYDTKIKSLQITIDEKKKTIQTVETEIELLQSQVKDREGKIAELENKLNENNKIYKVRIKSNFEKSFVSSLDLVVEGDNNFNTFLVQREFANTVAQETQRIAAELAKNRSALDDEKKKLQENLQKQEDLRDQAKAEAQDLNYQETGLGYQKEQKASLLDQSKENSKDLQKKREEINAIANQKQKELDNYLLEIISKRGNGDKVQKGDPIGKMGRSGYVLSCAGNGCYYPDPDKEPCGGAHLHFEVAKSNGKGGYVRTDPWPYIRDGKLGNPLKNYYVTQYYGENPQLYGGVSGHPGVDFVGDGNCGTPIYAGADGVINYYCKAFQWPGYRADPTYFAVLYDPINDINITYMHMQKAEGACGG